MFRYSKDYLQNALEEIRIIIWSILAANRKYDIPKGTLFNEIKWKNTFSKKDGF